MHEATQGCLAGAVRLVLAAVGRMKAGPERDLLDRYLSRSRGLLRQAGILGLDAWEIEESRAAAAETRQREEGAALLSKLAAPRRLLVCDERGRSATSAAFAALIEQARDAGVPAFAFAVGGPDGFEESVRGAATHTLSFGAATLPHRLVRVLLAEQIYRALTILTGHPYHRA